VHRTPVYLAFVNDPSPSMRMSALTIAMRINQFKPLPELINAALALLKDPNERFKTMPYANYGEFTTLRFRAVI
jgi:hypothetical protein